MKKFILIISTFIYLGVISFIPVFAQQGFILTAQADFKNVSITDGTKSLEQFDARTTRQTEPLLLYLAAPYKTPVGNNYGYNITPAGQPKQSNDSEIYTWIYQKNAFDTSKPGTFTYFNPPAKPADKCQFALAYDLDYIQDLNLNNASAADTYTTRAGKRVFKRPTDPANVDNPYAAAKYTVLALFYIPNGQKIEINPGIDLFNKEYAETLNKQFQLTYSNKNSTVASPTSPSGTQRNADDIKTFEAATTLLCNSGTFQTVTVQASALNRCDLTSTTFGKTTDLFGNPVPGVTTPIGCLPGTFTGIVAVTIRVLVGIGGAFTLIMILASIITIMTNSSDPGKVKEGYSSITKSVIGLFVIIFGVFILSLIGIKILDLPGLGAFTLINIFGS